jgi:cytochrome c-type biogenesis protein CcmH/NrfG
VAALEKVLQADYQDKEAHFLLGQSYVQLGLLEKATGEYNAFSMVNDLERANALLEQIQRKEKSAPAESPDSQPAADKKKGGRKTPRAKRH